MLARFDDLRRRAGSDICCRISIKTEREFYNMDSHSCKNNDGKPTNLARYIVVIRTLCGVEEVQAVINILSSLFERMSDTMVHRG